MRKKLYQMFILGTTGDGYKEALTKGLGGVIFFTNDIQNSKQIKDLITKCKETALIPPFISIDQEGGRVERTENIHNGKKYLSAKFAYEKGLDFLTKQTTEIAEELNNYGFNLNFAPCIDVNTNPNNPIIGERAFSNKVEDVTTAGKIVSEVYRKKNIIPCAKHYPGHGDANTDSHLELPKIDITLNEMEKTHIKPFAELSKTIEMIMIAHLHCTCFEKDNIPTSLSKNAIDYLRNELNFKGVTISDDMIMKGVSQYSQADAIEKGIKAGINIFIYRNSNSETIEAIEKILSKAQKDSILAEKIEESYCKIMDLKEKFNLTV